MCSYYDGEIECPSTECQMWLSAQCKKCDRVPNFEFLAQRELYWQQQLRVYIDQEGHTGTGKIFENSAQACFFHPTQACSNYVKSM